MADAENCRAARAGLAGRPCIGVASGSLARFRTSHRHLFPKPLLLGQTTRCKQRGVQRCPHPGLCETDAGRLVTQRRHETTSMSKKTASPAKEDRIKTRPRPDPSKPLRPDLSQMCQKGLPGRLSAMADPRATLILFPSPVVRPIPSRSSRGSPWQQTVACRALPCRGRGQLRSIQSTAAEFWNSSVELVSRDDSLRVEMVRWSSWCSPTTPPTSSWRAKQGRI